MLSGFVFFFLSKTRNSLEDNVQYEQCNEREVSSHESLNTSTTLQVIYYHIEQSVLLEAHSKLFGAKR